MKQIADLSVYGKILSIPINTNVVKLTEINDIVKTTKTAKISKILKIAKIIYL